MTFQLGKKRPAHLSWREPPGWSRRWHLERRKSAPWLKECAWVVAVMLATLPVWWLAHLAPSNEPPPFPVACGLGLLLGAVQVWFVPYANSFCTGEVRVMESHLMRSQGNSHRRMLWSDVREISLDWQDGCLLGTAVPLNPKKRPLTFAIPTPEQANELLEHLRKRGVPVREEPEQAEAPALQAGRF